MTPDYEILEWWSYERSAAQFTTERNVSTLSKKESSSSEMFLANLIQTSTILMQYSE
jgi:hypothetical protein